MIDREMQRVERENIKNNISLYMKYKTKNRLKKLALETGMSQGLVIEMLLEKYDEKEKQDNELLKIAKENQKLLIALKEQQEITNILAKTLLKINS
ncbi:TPA: hypothetical protein I0E96_RS15075 [Enterococcus faecalis]|nr:hypothetical protein [Enterococcus canis]NSN97776.1 hypothetical protein [Enterococcus faecalis]HBI1562961.1 hypothetical protein [Enterococcus faecalis]HBI1566074.1 hypothetical protein [Enterococcus faecalis]HBI1770355.1 hypothetical protein [Enterococcus faecalis]